MPTVLPYPKSKLDGMQTLQYGFDEQTQSFRTTASFSGDLTINLDPATDGVHIADPDTGNTLEINADGSINTNVAVTHTDDSIALGDGVDLFTSTVIGPKRGLDINLINASTLASETTLSAISTAISTLNSIVSTSTNQLDIAAKLDDILTQLQSLVVSISNEVEVKNDAGNPLNIAAASLPLPTGAATATNQDATNTKLDSILNQLQNQSVAVSNEIEVKNDTGNPLSIQATSLPLPTGAATAAIQTAANAILQSIDTKLTAPLSVNAALVDEPIKLSGTENGLPNGTEFTLVNNRRLQILNAKDREQSITYADFGTKDQRVTQIDYTASLS